MISFNHPVFFFLLFIFPAIFILKKTGFVFTPEFRLNLINWNGIKPKQNTLIGLLNFVSLCFLYAGVFLLIIAIAEPVTFKTEQVYTDEGNSIMFLIDISPSMAAKDINGESRIESAKRIIRKFVSRYPGDSFGLTALASSAALIVPPTIDHKVFLARLNSLSIGELGDGTALGMGLAVSSIHSRHKAKDKRSSYIILLTDGENNTGEINPKTAAQMLIRKNIGFYVIGIGNSGYTALEYTDIKTGKTYSGSLYSRFDEKELKKISAYGNGRYASANSSEKLEEIFNTISAQVPASQFNFTQTIEKNLYKPFLLSVIFCFAAVWIIRRLLMRMFL
jgi:batA protein, putative